MDFRRKLYPCFNNIIPPILKENTVTFYWNNAIKSVNRSVYCWITLFNVLTRSLVLFNVSLVIIPPSIGIMVHYPFYPTDALNHLHDQRSVNQVEISNIRAQRYIQKPFLPYVKALWRSLAELNYWQILFPINFTLNSIYICQITTNVVSRATLVIPVY